MYQCVIKEHSPVQYHFDGLIGSPLGAVATKALGGLVVHVSLIADGLKLSIIYVCVYWLQTNFLGVIVV